MSINIVLNLILIPINGAEGAAFASMITQCFTVLFQLIIFKKIFGFKFNLKHFLQLLMFSGLCIVVPFYVSELKINWMYSFLLSIVIMSLFSFITQLISIKDSFKLIQEYKSKL